MIHMFITILFLSIGYLQSSWAVNPTETDANVNYDTLLIMYSETGCAIGTEGMDGWDRGTSHFRNLSKLTLKELERQINEEFLQNQKDGFASEIDQKLLHEEAKEAEERAVSETNSAHSAGEIKSRGARTPSIKLKSRHLDSIITDVVNVPSGFSGRRVMELARNLPCVEKVSPDYIRPVNQGPFATSQRIVKVNPDSLGGEQFVNFEDPKSNPLSRNLDTDTEFSLADIRAWKKITMRLRGPNNRVIPNDALYWEQWHLFDEHSINVGNTWGSWRGSSEMVVAVIDDGCDRNHNELAGQTWINKGEICDDGIDNDENGFVDDCFGWDFVDNDNNVYNSDSSHGTVVSGVVAARSNNFRGVASICWNCRIMCLRAVGHKGNALSNTLMALDYAVSFGVKVSNNSYGTYDFPEDEYHYFKRFQNAGHIMVSSAGNEAVNTDLPENQHAPSTYPLTNVISVGASTRTGELAKFSNYGSVTVDLFAPGTDILSTMNGNRYGMADGTSLAAPQVTGVIAMVWSRYPSLSYTQIYNTVVDSCTKTDELKSSVCGGRVSLADAMERARKLVDSNRQEIVNQPERLSAFFSTFVNILSRYLGRLFSQ